MNRKKAIFIGVALTGIIVFSISALGVVKNKNISKGSSTDYKNNVINQKQISLNDRTKISQTANTVTVENTNNKNPREVEKTNAMFSSSISDESVLAQFSQTIVIGTIKQVLPLKWNTPGRVINLGQDAQGYFKGYSWVDSQGMQRDERELGVFGAVKYQEYLVEVEQVLKDIEPENTAPTEEQFREATQWKPSKPVTNNEIIRVRLNDAEQYISEGQNGIFITGDKVLLMLTKTNNVSKKVGPEHYTMDSSWGSFKLTDDGYALRNHVPASESKIKLDDLLKSINKTL